jgi:Cu-Zn family superoxide dismutase
MNFVNIVSIGIIGLVTGNVFMTKPKQTKARADFLTGKISGYVEFAQVPNTHNVTIEVNLSGFEPNTSHGFHVHMKPIKPSDSCDQAGPHFDPTGSPHGGPHESHKKRHVGDLGNILADANGNVKVKFSDYLIELSGTNSIVGRTLVVHEKEDDLKTIESSGKRIGCGAIIYTHN